jgi:hypothetical protein
MATRTRFTAIPSAPQAGAEEWLVRTLTALKENVELLTASRGEPDLASAALTRSSIRVATPPAQTMQRVSARGSGVSISGTNVPVLEDYVALTNDVQKLANDVANLRATVELLLTELKG